MFSLKKIFRISKSNISKDEKRILKNAHFHLSIAEKIKDIAPHSIFVNADINIDSELSFKNKTVWSNLVRKELKAIKILFAERTEYMFASLYLKELKAYGYFGFSTINNKNVKDIIVVKTKEIFDVLGFMGTNGINFGHYVEDIADKLNEWEKRYGITIYGLDYSSIIFGFDKKPNNIKLLAQEIYEFCPDLVDQNLKDIKLLEKLIESEEEITLWWD